ncbi:MAG: hypothetical protein ACK50J_13920, partial [Planctomyces sp.]
MNNTTLTTAQRVFRTRGAYMVFAVLIMLLAWEGFEWTFNRIYVPDGYSLVMRYKGPPLPFLPGNRPVAAPGQFARVDDTGSPLEIGILKNMRGPGRHFCWIGWWETKLVADTIVKPGEVAVVSSKMGENLPDGQFLVDGDLDDTKHRGIVRKVLGPGIYRINSYAYDVKVIQEITVESGN